MKIIKLTIELRKLLSLPIVGQTDKPKFLYWITKNKLTRDENIESHVCIYFAAFDPIVRQVFIGLHKKSGLWLFNGGHIEKEETLLGGLEREMSEEWGSVEKHANIPSLLTITKIKLNPNQKCKWHYDVWYFIKVNKNKFLPKKENLESEFTGMCWLGIKEAKKYVSDPNTLKVLFMIEKQFQKPAF